MRKKPKRPWIELLAENFFAESPMYRMMYRTGLGRKRMRMYRKIKASRRPQCFRQDVW